MSIGGRRNKLYQKQEQLRIEAFKKLGKLLPSLWD